MPEVQARQVEEVDHQQELCEPEAATDPEHDEAEGEQVIEDEVAADVGGGEDELGRAAVEEHDVAELLDEEPDPVDAGDDDVEREGRLHAPVLAPYCVALV